MNSAAAGEQHTHSRNETRSPHTGIFRIDLLSPFGRLASRKLQIDHYKRSVLRSYQAVQDAEPLVNGTQGSRDA